MASVRSMYDPADGLGARQMEVDPRVLSRIKLFEDLSDDDLEGLAGFLRRRRFSRGHIILVKGDPGTSLYMIESGRVKIVLTSREGKEIVLAIQGEEEVFGELALLDGEPRSADAVAHEDC